VQLSRVLHLPSRASGPKGCRCGHSEHAHEHYRRGNDCALCACPRFKAGAAAPHRGSRGSRGEQVRAA
jgi:hypothetical protein